LNKHIMATFIFDLDGTLADSRYDIAESVNLTLDRLSVPRLPVGQIITCVGSGVRALLAKVIVKLGVDMDVTEAEMLFREIYSDHLTEKTVLYDEIGGIFPYLKQKGHSIFVISNKPHRFTERILSHFDLMQYITAFYGGDAMPVLKPDRAVFDEMAAAYSLDPSQTYMIGDSNIDGEFAKNCGIHFILVAYGGFIGADELSSIRSEYRAETPRDLDAVIRKLCSSDAGL